MYNYYQQQQFYAPRAQLKGRPVSSLEEARAMAIDFDGSVFYFPDLANNKIYTKQVNLDGTATLNMYELKPIEMQLTTDYVTREEFEAALSKILNSEKLQQPVEQQPKQKVQQPLNF